MALVDTIGSALRCVGVRRFLDILPFRLKTTPTHMAIDSSREWLLGVFQMNLKLIPCRLSDFSFCILRVLGSCSSALKRGAASLSAAETSVARMKIMQLWSLFPGFCAYGCPDVAASFPELQRTLEAAIRDESYPELLGVVCSGVTRLIEATRAANSAPAVEVLRSGSSTFLPLLLGILEPLDVSDHRFQTVATCIAAWTSVSTEALVVSLCKRLLKLLLSSTSSSDTSDEAAGWMTVILSIMPYLPDSMVQLIYRSVRPFLSIEESVSLQKRAYRVLHSLLEYHSEVLSTIESRISILAAISNSILNCHVSARHMRLTTMEALLKNMTDEEVAAAVPSILGEVLICQKDANKKSRSAALGVLRVIVNRMDTSSLLTLLCSAVVAETVVMRASAIVALCLVLVHKRTEPIAHEFAIQLLPVVTVLLNQDCVEQARAVLSFVKTCCAVLSPNELRLVLPYVAASPFSQTTSSSKPKFTSRYRAILRKLNLKISDDELRQHVPQSDIALLEYVIKQSRRVQRQRAENAKQRDESFEAMMNSDSEGSDDEGDGDRTGQLSDEFQILDTRFPTRAKATHVSKESQSMHVLPETLDDILEDQPRMFANNPQTGRTKHQKSVSARDAADEDDEYTVSVTKDGRVVVQEKEEFEEVKVDTDDHAENGGRGNSDSKQSSTSQPSREKGKKRMREPGEEYRAKRAGGDIWRQGQLEPHAFIPLDAKLLTKKNTQKAVDHFGVVIKGKHSKSLSKNNHGARAVGNRRQRETARVHRNSFAEKE